jgi:hypothetical protein
MTTSTAVEVFDWIADALQLHGTLTRNPQSPLPNLPDACAGDESDEAVGLLGLLTACGIAVDDEGGPARLERELLPRANMVATHQVSGLVGALIQAQRRVLQLARAGHGPILLPSMYQLHADARAVCGPAEALLDPQSLPEAHPLRATPRDNLVGGKWLAVGRWKASPFGQRQPPGPILANDVRERTLRFVRGDTDLILS